MTNTPDRYEQAMRDLGTLIIILSNDVKQCHIGIEQYTDPTQYAAQFWRRAYVRASFASIEGVVYGMKQVALAVGDTHGANFSLAETYILTEQSYELDRQGNIKDPPSPAKISLRANIRFAFRMLAQSFGFAYELRVDQHQWDYFLRSQKIRDRLVHPKTVAELYVTDEEIEMMKQTSMWFAVQTQDLMQHIAHHLGLSY